MHHTGCWVLDAKAGMQAGAQPRGRRTLPRSAGARPARSGCWQAGGSGGGRAPGGARSVALSAPYTRRCMSARPCSRRRGV
eukprot:gene24512-biopygen22399